MIGVNYFVKLNALVSHLNKITGHEQNPWSSKPDPETNRYVANLGTYYVDALGDHRYQLAQVDTKGGGINQPLGSEHLTAKELYHRVHAFIRGIETGLENTRNTTAQALKASKPEAENYEALKQWNITVENVAFDLAKTTDPAAFRTAAGYSH